MSALRGLAEHSDTDILDGLRQFRGNVALAAHWGCTEQAIRRAIKRRGLEKQAKMAVADIESIAAGGESRAEKPSLKMEGDSCTLITEVNPELVGDIDALVESRGLKLVDWIIVSVVLNEWDGMTAVSSKEDRTVKLKQVKVTLKRRVSMTLVSPANYVPPIKRTGKIIANKGEPDLIIVESDHQIPYHDPRLHEASLKMIATIQPHEHDFLGDTIDLPTISKYMDHPAITAVVQECIDVGHRVLRDKAEASPNTRRQKLKGNHDWRLESEQLLRSERLYGIHPAGEDIAALDIRRLLQLEALGIELVTDQRGWEHAEIVIVPGKEGLVARHGWLTGTNSAERAMKKRGRSLIVGHTHRREHSFLWDPSMGCERQAVTLGCMCLVRNERHPAYVTCDNWLQGFGVVSRWSNGRFDIEHVRWDGHTLVWRNERFTA